MELILLIDSIVLWIVVLALLGILALVVRNLAVLHAAVTGDQAPEQTTLEPTVNPRTKVRNGEHLPELRVMDATGAPASTEDFSGRPAALAIVRPGCGGCSEFLSIAFQDGADPLDADFPADGIVVVSLAEPEETQRFLDDVGVKPVRVLVDPGGDAIRKAWGISMTPAMMIVDSSLTVIRQVFGTAPLETGDSRFRERRPYGCIEGERRPMHEWDGSGWTDRLLLRVGKGISRRTAIKGGLAAALSVVGLRAFDPKSVSACSGCQYCVSGCTNCYYITCCSTNGYCLQCNSTCGAHSIIKDYVCDGFCDYWCATSPC